MKKKIGLTLMMICTLFSLRGEEVMTLNDCLLYARGHALSNRISRVRGEMAQIDVNNSISSFLPSVGFSTGGNISFGRNIDPETNTYDTRKTVSNSYGLSMSLPIFNGLININNLKISKVARRRQQYSAQSEEDRISLDVIRAFYNVSYVSALVEQMRVQLSRDSLMLAGVMREFSLGTKSGADVAEMKAVVASDEYELTNQMNNLRKAYLSLKGNMGMPLDEKDPVLKDGEEYYVEESGGEHPRISAAKLALKESSLRVNVAKGSFLPSIGFSGGVSTSFYRLIGDKGTSPSFRQQFRNNMGEYLGVSLSLPIFSGLSRIHNLKRAKLNELESRLALEQTEYEIERETRDAMLDFKASEEEYESAVRRLEAEEIAYNAILRKFELGDASAIDLFTAGSRLASAKAGKEGKRIQRIISGILLSYYKGGKLIAENIEMQNR